MSQPIECILRCIIFRKNEKKKYFFIILAVVFVNFIINRHSKGEGYTVRLYLYFLMFVRRFFFEECSDFDIYFSFPFFFR